MILVHKSDTKWRMCIKYSKLKRAFIRIFTNFLTSTNLNSLIIHRGLNSYFLWMFTLGIVKFQWTPLTNIKQISQQARGIFVTRSPFFVLKTQVQHTTE